jgi:positive regulator of sigma E activity
MKERGIATKVDGAAVTVRIGLSEGCAACSASGGGCGIAGKELEAVAMPGTAISVGDVVELQIPDSAKTSGVLWLLVMPLALFFAGYLGIGAFIKSATEGTQALSGLAGLVLGLGTAMLAARYGKLSRRPSAVAVSDF